MLTKEDLLQAKIEMLRLMDEKNKEVREEMKSLHEEIHEKMEDLLKHVDSMHTRTLTCIGLATGFLSILIAFLGYLIKH